MPLHPPQLSHDAASRGELPPLLPLTTQALTIDGAFLLDDGAALTLWLGRSVPTEFLQNAFGWPTLENIDASTLRLLPPETSPLAAYIHAVRIQRAQHPRSL